MIAETLFAMVLARHHSVNKSFPLGTDVPLYIRCPNGCYVTDQDYQLTFSNIEVKATYNLTRYRGQSFYALPAVEYYLFRVLQNCPLQHVTDINLRAEVL